MLFKKNYNTKSHKNEENRGLYESERWPMRCYMYTKPSTRENLCRGSVALMLKAKFGLKDLSTTLKFGTNGFTCTRKQDCGQS